MNPIGSVTSPGTVIGPLRTELAPRPATLGDPGRVNGAAFGELLDGLVDQVTTKQAQAGDLTRRVLLGETDQLHRSVIAMQEASVAFSLMVEVRNKLVESYQELMRMQV
jgi:flagellar hook-basal body complex protein FliE